MNFLADVFQKWVVLTYGHLCESTYMYIHVHSSYTMSFTCSSSGPFEYTCTFVLMKGS